MDGKTVSHYDTHAREASARYESADMSRLHAMLLRHLPPKGASVLELGCGSGRDAAFLQANGFDVTAVDASPGMIAEAARLHPELAGGLSCAAVPFPGDSPLLRRSFDAVFSNAMFMHIPDPELPLVVEQVRRMMRRGGAVVIGARARYERRAGVVPAGSVLRGGPAVAADAARREDRARGAGAPLSGGGQRATILRYGCTAYDAVYISLALGSDSRLLTAERTTTSWVVNLGIRVQPVR